MFILVQAPNVACRRDHPVGPIDRRWRSGIMRPQLNTLGATSAMLVKPSATGCDTPVGSDSLEAREQGRHF